MPRKPERAVRDDGRFNVVTVVPGWLKNEIVSVCEEQGVSVQRWVQALLISGVRERRGLPALREGRLPDVGEVVGSFLAGEQVLMPCGRRVCEPVERVLDGFSFCDVCGVRFT